MDEHVEDVSAIPTFNGPVEVGLRALSILDAIYPAGLSLDELVMLDYIVVHSDDLPGGPPSLHPKTPLRSGEMLVRRALLIDGLQLYQSRGLTEELFTDDGIRYAAADRSSAFLDCLKAPYAISLRERAAWTVQYASETNKDELAAYMWQNLDKWGTEFVLGNTLAVDGDYA